MNRLALAFTATVAVAAPLVASTLLAAPAANKPPPVAIFQPAASAPQPQPTKRTRAPGRTAPSALEPAMLRAAMESTATSLGGTGRMLSSTAASPIVTLTPAVPHFNSSHMNFWGARAVIAQLPMPEAVLDYSETSLTSGNALAFSWNQGAADLWLMNLQADSIYLLDCSVAAAPGTTFHAAATYTTAAIAEQVVPQAHGHLLVGFRTRNTRGAVQVGLRATTTAAAAQKQHGWSLYECGLHAL